MATVSRDGLSVALIRRLTTCQFKHAIAASGLWQWPLLLGEEEGGVSQ